MSFLKKVLKNNNVLSLAGNVTAAGLGFLSFALLARMLDKDSFGNLMIFITLGTFFDLLRTGFLQTPLIKFSSVPDPEESKKVIGSSWVFGVLITTAIGALTLMIYFVFGDSIANEGFITFLKFIWVLNLATLPFNFATWILQSELKFNRIIFIRWMNLGTFVGALLLNYFLFHKGIDYVIYSFIACNIFASLLCIILGWTRISYIRYAAIGKMKELLNFGKFSMSTMIGSNLLRSSDTFMIGVLMSPAAVAIYSIPAKLFEVIEIPLRSFVATALPTFSRYINEGNKEGLRSLFEKASGMITIMLIPCVAICLFFAEYLVTLLGGEQYAESANILRIFAGFALLMPLDRYTGVMLDVLNRPKNNFQKIAMMLLIKVGGNFVVIYSIGQVWAVAVTSVFTFAGGVLIGIWFLRKSIDFSIKRVLHRGYKESVNFAIRRLNKNYLPGN